MNKVNKVLSLAIATAMLAVSVSAHDIVGNDHTTTFGNRAEINAGYCAYCGSTLVVHREYCAAYSVDGDVLDYSIPCTEHNSCHKRCVVAYRFYEEKCRSCGVVKASASIPDTSHLEFYVDETTGEIVSVCTLSGHMS